ncbi:Calx-beta domain-containing protein [Donghicola sp.]|uniref:Calx-beta domain-containing protein n=1 Tax=Donghicola sp. TaxID=1929294 RepID=UPI0025E316D5|nr:Calx-beta domain-containing protein [Donghicola sp.]MCT4575808.1 hypothetical protein [Donghicola sp.]
MPLITSSSGIATESDAVVFTLSLSAPAADAVTVQYQAQPNGSATDADLSYNFASGHNTGTVIFSPGETTATVTIYTKYDYIDERDESFTLRLFNPSANAGFVDDALTLLATGVILDDDGAGANTDLFVSDPVIVEGNSATQTAVFEIRLSQPASTAFSVDYTTKDGAAKAGTDYVPASGTLTFAAGQQAATVGVEVKGDKRSEVTEAFDLVLTPSSSLSLGSTNLAGTATIQDDDSGSGPVISISDGTSLESEGVLFALTLSEPATDAVTVNYQTRPNGSANDDDLSYSFGSSHNTGIVTFAAGQTTAFVTVYTKYDYVDERDESFTLELYDPSENAVLAGGGNVLSATGFILDDDGAGVNNDIFVSDVVLVEGKKGTQTAVFDIQLSRPASSDVTVDYTTKDGSATAGEDYIATSGSITFEPGQQLASVAVEVKGDKTPEPTEYFDLIVTPTSSQSLGTASLAGTATIQDDDSGKGPIVSLSDGQAVESEAVVFEVSLSKPATDAITLNYRTLSNSSAVDDDLSYSFASSHNSGEVTFTAGETTAFVTVYTKYDYVDERDESFTLELYNAPENVGFAGGVDRLRANGVILDDDGAGSNTMLVGSPNDIFEGASRSQTVPVEVHLSQPLDSKQSFFVSATELTATEGKDFRLVTKTISFEPGETTATVWIKTFRDKATETPETFSLDFEAKGTTQVNGVIPSVTVTIADGPGFVPGPTNKADKITGTSAGDNLRGLGGDDTITGAGGNDTLNGDNGNDVLKGDAGNDLISGGNGADTVKGGGGSDDLRGNGGNDELTGNNGNDELSGGAGHDNLLGGGGSDVLFGDSGQDTLNGGKGRDYLDGGKGDDVLTGGGQPDDFAYDIKRGGNDTITDFGEADTLIFYKRGFEITKEKAKAFVNEYAEVTDDGVLFDFGKKTTLLVEDVDTTDELISAISFDYDL